MEAFDKMNTSIFMLIKSEYRRTRKTGVHSLLYWNYPKLFKQNKKKKLKARYKVVLPIIYSVLIILPDGIREKLMVCFNR